MVKMSVRDELTGLDNRRYLIEFMECESAFAKRYERKVILSMMDLVSITQMTHMTILPVVSL